MKSAAADLEGGGKAWAGLVYIGSTPRLRRAVRT